MTITTLEALSAVPPGDTVTLPRQSNAVWTRVAEGFTYKGVTLTAEQMGLELGHIQGGGVPVAGDLLFGNGVYYFVVAAREGGGFDTVTFDTGGGIRDVDLPLPETHIRVDGAGLPVPDWWGPVMAETLRSHHRALVNRVSVDPDPELLAWMGNYGHDYQSRLAELLRDSGIAIPNTEEIEVEVVVEGRHEVHLDRDDVTSLLGFTPSGNVDAETITIGWDTTVTVEVTVEAGECGCDQVSRSTVESLLGASVTSGAEGWDWEPECPNC